MFNFLIIESAGPSKRAAGDEIKITNLRTQKERKMFLQTTMPQSFENQKVWEFQDPKAQKFHKSIFDNFIVMDLQPFSIVNKKR